MLRRAQLGFQLLGLDAVILQQNPRPLGLQCGQGRQEEGGSLGRFPQGSCCVLCIDALLSTRESPFQSWVSLGVFLGPWRRC